MIANKISAAFHESHECDMFPVFTPFFAPTYLIKQVVGMKWKRICVSQMWNRVKKKTMKAAWMLAENNHNLDKSHELHHRSQFMSIFYYLYMLYMYAYVRVLCLYVNYVLRATSGTHHHCWNCQKHCQR